MRCGNKYALTNCHCNIDVDTVTFIGPCIISGKECSVTVPLAGVVAWERGALIQNAFPSVDKNVREFLISGISPEGWERTFSDDLDD